MKSNKVKVLAAKNWEIPVNYGTREVSSRVCVE